VSDRRDEEAQEEGERLMLEEAHRLQSELVAEIRRVGNCDNGSGLEARNGIAAGSPKV
jgi:hypothetical protein